MDIRQLRYFAAVVEAGTISAAAKKLHISQPPLSAQMRQLEDELQVLLFERGSRQIKLTEAGSLLYRSAREMLELEQVTREEISNFQSGRRGALRLGLVSSCDCRELFRGITEFHSRFTDVEFKVYEGNTYELLDFLKNGKIELAVIRTPFPSYDLEECFLKKDRMLAAGREEYLPGVRSGRANTEQTDKIGLHSAGIAQQSDIRLQSADMGRTANIPQQSITLEQLAHVPLLLYRRWEPIVRKCFGEQGIAPTVVCINDDARTSLQWANAGLGVALVPASIAGWGSGLQVCEISSEELASALVLVKRRQAPLSTSAAAFFELFRET